MTDWRSQYESAAEAEAARLSRASDFELIRAIRTGTTGGYYTLWQAIAGRKPSAATNWLLFNVLTSSRPYLDRYHAAGALLQLLHCDLFEPVELSADWPVVAENLGKLRQLLLSRFGPPPEGSTLLDTREGKD